MKSLVIILLFVCVACSSKEPSPGLGFIKASEFSDEWLQYVSQTDPVEFNIPEAQTWKLENGITVLYLANPELPFVSGTLLMPGGSYLAAEGGYLTAMQAASTLMRSGGGGQYSPEELDEKLDRLAASIGVNFGTEYSALSFSSLRDKLTGTLDLFNAILRKPKFDSHRLDVWKGQQLEGIRRRQDRPETITSIARKQLLYHGSPYSFINRSSNIKKLRRSDLLEVYQKFINPEGAYLVLSGDLSQEEAQELAAGFGAWKPASRTLEQLQNLSPKPLKGVFHIAGNFQQSTVFIGHIGPRRLGPDHYKIRVFNRLFGGEAFTSELFRHVRDSLGLAYVTYGVVRDDLIPGQSMIYLQTKEDQTLSAIEESLQVLDKLKREKYPEEVIKTAVGSVANSFVFNYDSYYKILSQKASLEIMGYPDDYLQTYLSELRQVTPEDVRYVAQKYWNPEEFIVLVVGGNAAYNLLKEAVKNPNSRLYGKPLKQLKFDETLVF